jgi:NAD-dependent oxidoreductase involved in siderophore biosynthesis
MATAKLILACLVVLSSASGDTCQSTAEHLVSRAVQEYPGKTTSQVKTNNGHSNECIQQTQLCGAGRMDPQS